MIDTDDSIARCSNLRKTILKKIYFFFLRGTEIFSHFLFSVQINY